MSAVAPTASTILSVVSSRPRRPIRALVALALLVGFIVRAGSWVYLGPIAVTYFTVTSPADPASGFGMPTTMNLQVDTRAAAIRSLGDTPYTSITGPFISSLPVPRDWNQDADADRFGVLIALLAYVAFYLLGVVSGRFRRFEVRLGNAGAAFGRALGATARAKAESLLLVVGGAVVSGLVYQGLIGAGTAAADPWRNMVPEAGLLLGVTALLAIVAMGIPAAIGLSVRRAGISRGVGPFLVGYGGLLAVSWLDIPLGVANSCLSNPEISNAGMVAPPACVVNVAVRTLSDGILTLELGLVTLLYAIPAVGAILVYQGYRRRQAARSEPNVTAVLA